MNFKSNIIVNIPHASTQIPEEERKYYQCADMQKELDLMTDHFTDDLFDTEEGRLIFPVSRLVVDAERFRSDEEEEMAKKGMGAVYTHCHDLSVLREVDPTHREELLRTYYDPYHQAFEEAVQRKLEAHGSCLIIDGHSFPEHPLPYENDQNPNRPDICIGTDGYHTPKEVSGRLIDYFKSKGYTVALNAPFAGAIVPGRFYRKEPLVQSVMIEINRGLYIDDHINKKPEYDLIKSDIKGAIELLRQ